MPSYEVRLITYYKIFARALIQTIQRRLSLEEQDRLNYLRQQNETGEIIKINQKTRKVIVQGINFKFKHVKPNTENEIGEIKQFEEPIHHSNVKLNSKKVS